MKSFEDTLTVNLNEINNSLVIIDQTKLPGRFEILELHTQAEIWDAIYKLKVRGAPAIGVAAAIGIYLAALEIETDQYSTFYEQFKAKKDYLASSRPTAVNLFWALNRMEEVVLNNSDKPVQEIKKLLLQEAKTIMEEDIESCRKIGEFGAELLNDGDGVLTHCNAGRLATVKYGTALAPIYVSKEQGKKVHVYTDETRPLLQGARLSAYELHNSGIDTTLLCDNMAATAMKKGLIQIVFVGADRIAANGDTANKIGTMGVAIMAKHFNIPFYVCAPLSTIDCNTPTGDEITIEQRPSEEVTDMWYKERMAPEGISVLNPAFDVTDHSLITGIITEYGIIKAPYEQSIRDLFKKKNISQKG
jgi:methylthioribose-1-phosphate isomerase